MIRSPVVRVRTVSGVFSMVTMRSTLTTTSRPIEAGHAISCVLPRAGCLAYRLIVMSSASSESAVVSVLEFAWKPRWAAIMRMNSAAMSTFDCSSAPATMAPRSAVAG